MNGISFDSVCDVALSQTQKERIRTYSKRGSILSNCPHSPPSKDT